MESPGSTNPGHPAQANHRVKSIGSEALGPLLWATVGALWTCSGHNPLGIRWRHPCAEDLICAGPTLPSDRLVTLSRPCRLRANVATSSREHSFGSAISSLVLARHRWCEGHASTSPVTRPAPPRLGARDCFSRFVCQCKGSPCSPSPQKLP